MDQIQGVSAEITLEKPVLAQVDGDMLGRHAASCDSAWTARRLCVRVPEVAPDDVSDGNRSRRFAIDTKPTLSELADRGHSS